MLKIMLVDDEIYFRKALAVSLNWKEYGFEICGEAEDGEKALIALNILRPDIVLVDINLPIVNGLDFIKQAKTMNHDLKYVIITGYAHFEYAQQAIELGVDSFVLKPIKEAELKKVLNELKNKIESETEIKKELDSLKKKVRESLPIAKEKLLADLMEGKWLMDNQNLRKKLDYLGIDTQDALYRVLVVDIDPAESEVSTQMDMQLRKLAVEKITSKILGFDFNVEKCVGSEDNIRFVIIDRNLRTNDAQSKILDGCVRITNSINEHLNCTASIGVGNTYDNIRDIGISYQESLVALESGVISGKTRVVFYDTIAETGLRKNVFPSEYKNRLLMDLRTFNKIGICGLVDKVMDPSGERFESKDLLLTCIHFITTAAEFLSEHRESFESIFSCDIYSIIKEYRTKKSICEISDWLKHILSRTVEIIKDRKSEKGQSLVIKAKKFMEAHYSDNDLKVETIADSVYINPTYLGNLFRKYLGMTIIEYLINIRMQMAKELLDKDCCYISDIARQVGFSDAGYFSKSFKKFYGVTPTQYCESRHVDNDGIVVLR